MKTAPRVFRTRRFVRNALPNERRDTAAVTVRSKGFNLLEVMMASTILIVGATGVFMGMSSTTKSEQRMNDLTVASQVLESAAETLLSLPPQHTWLAPGIHDSGDAPLHFNHFGVPVAENDAKFAVIWSVLQNQSPQQTMNGIHQIEIRVTWQAAGEEQSTAWRVHRR